MLHLAKRVNWILAGKTGASASLQTFITRIFVLCVNVATGMITARMLGDSGRGEQAAMMLWPGLLASFLSFGLPSALLYRSKHNMEKHVEFLSASLLLSLAFGVAAIGSGWVAIPRLMHSYDPVAIQFSRLMMLMAPIQLMSAVLQANFQLEGKFSAFNRNAYAAPLFTLLGLLGLVFLGKLSPFTACLAYSLPGVPIIIWMLRETCSSLKLIWPGWRSTVIPLFACGVKYYGMEILGRVSLEIDKVLVIGMLSPSQMGYYSVVLSFSRMLTIFHSSLSSVLLPKTTAREPEEVVYLTGVSTRICILLTGTVALLVGSLGEFVLHLLYGSEFLPAVNTLRVLLIEVVIGSAAWMLAQTFLALGKPSIVTFFQMVGFSISVPLMILLIPRYGILGAAISLTASTILRLCFVQLCFSYLLNIRPPSLLPCLGDISYLRRSFSSY